MSSYLVDDSTINTILAGLRNMEVCYLSIYFRKPSHISPIFSGVEFDTKAAELGQAMRDLNEKGTGVRYDRTEEMPYKYAAICAPSKIQLMKSIQCLLYQANEGDISETDPLYKALYDFSVSLAFGFAESLPAYEAAEWG